MEEKKVIEVWREVWKIHLKCTRCGAVDTGWRETQDELVAFGLDKNKFMSGRLFAPAPEGSPLRGGSRNPYGVYVGPVGACCVPCYESRRRTLGTQFLTEEEYIESITEGLEISAHADLVCVKVDVTRAVGAIHSLVHGALHNVSRRAKSQIGSASAFKRKKPPKGQKPTKLIVEVFTSET